MNQPEDGPRVREVADGGQPAESKVLEALERILASKDFRASERRRNFLEYIVEAALAGKADRLKGYVIATEVFGRGEDFDPQIDPIVRLEASRLRRDLEFYYVSSGKDDPILISIPKGGNVPVFERRKGEPVPDLAGAVAEATEPALQLPALATRRRWLGIAAVGAVLAIATALLWYPFSRTTESPDPTLGDATTSPAALPKGPSIAVLPFRNLSSDPAQEFFSDGITDRIVTNLCRFKALFVMALQSTLKYKNQPSDPQEIGRQLGVDYIVEGSVARSTDTVRISVRLVDAETGGLLWGDAYDRELDPGAISDIQADISQRVASIIGAKHGTSFAGTSLARIAGPPTSLGAYDCVLQYFSYSGAVNRERHSRIRACLEQAVAEDPSYADAWAILALVYSLEYRQGFNPRPEMYDARERSLDYARRAVALDPENATAHSILSLAHFHLHDLDGFREAGGRALEQNPNDSEILARHGMRLAFIGEWDQGLALMRKAMTLNPAHTGFFYFPFVFYYYDREEYDRALDEILKVDLPDFFWYQMAKSMTLGQLGHTEEAHAAVEKLLGLKPGIRQAFWTVMRDWNFQRPLVEHFADGLRKAGLDLAPEP